MLSCSTSDLEDVPIVKAKRSYNTSKIRTKKLKPCKQCGLPFMAGNNSKYCSLLCAQHNEYAANMLKVEWRIGKLLAAAKNRATAKKLPFDLTQQYLELLWATTDGRCPISGVFFDLSKYGTFGQVNPNAPSIDRIVPSKGYVIGNIRFVTYHVNVALSEFGLDNLLILADNLIKMKEFNGKEST